MALAHPKIQEKVRWYQAAGIDNPQTHLRCGSNTTSCHFIQNSILISHPFHEKNPPLLRKKFCIGPCKKKKHTFLHSIKPLEIN